MSSDPVTGVKWHLGQSRYFIHDARGVGRKLRNVLVLR